MAAEKPRAVDDVGAALADELDQLGILLRRILEVGVLNDHEIAGDLREAAPQRRAFAGVLRLQQQLEAELALQPRRGCRACRRSNTSSTTMSSIRSGTASTRRMISSIVSRSL